MKILDYDYEDKFNEIDDDDNKDKEYELDLLDEYEKEYGKVDVEDIDCYDDDDDDEYDDDDDELLSGNDIRHQDDYEAWQRFINGGQ